jgi:DNA-binding CsgD family transcriptional regulator
MPNAAIAPRIDKSAASGDGVRMRQRVKLIAPLAQRAQRIDQAIDPRQSEAATFADTLDGLSAGIFLVDAGCRIVHANAAGHDILRADDFLRCIDGQLVARNLRADQDVREAVADDSGAPAAEGIALLLAAHDGERYIMHMLRLTSPARTGTGTTCKAVAALFVRKVALERPCGELVARTFQLTPAELRVLFAIVEIGGVPETAAALGIAPTTVKTHLHRVFAKTGARHQADLVKLVAGFSNPLAG